MRGFKCRDLALLFTLVHTHDFDVCSRCVDVVMQRAFGIEWLQRSQIEASRGSQMEADA